MMSMAMPSLEFLVWEKETPRVVMVVSASPKAEVEREYTRKRDKVNMPFIIWKLRRNVMGGGALSKKSCIR